MPKIIFRPNPTPPPFVPPTPPEPTNIVVLSKYPFMADEPVFVYFDNVEVPQNVMYSFEVYVNELQNWSTVWEFETSLPNESNPYEIYFEHDSSEISGFRINCIEDEVSIKIVPLIVQTE